jgi:hypothetical protein
MHRSEVQKVWTIASLRTWISPHKSQCCKEIAQYMFRAAERPLGVDDPVVAEQHS